MGKLNIEIDIPAKAQRPQKYAVNALRDPVVKNRFAVLVDDEMAQYTDMAETEDLNLEYARLVDAFQY